jgi:hypothetical protein
MKKLLVAIAAVLISAATFAQEGAVVFNNHIVGSVEAKVTLNGDATKGAGLAVPAPAADLFLVSLNGAAKGVSLSPTTTFRSSSAAASFYINGVDVAVPGSSPGDTAVFIMRAYNAGLGADAAKASGNGYGESSPFTVALGGGANPPANLTTLSGFNYSVVPEPSTIALGLLGAAALLIRRRK